MKTLCITGIAHPALDAVAQVFFSSGLAPARSSPRHDGLDIHEWHQRVLAQNPDQGAIKQLGRLWEQLAADIFLGNIESPAWGWQDERSVALLDFWHHFDPHLYVVLVCVSPQQALAQAIATPTDNTPDQVLEHWYRQHQTMLRFHLRHPERSLLVMADDVLLAPDRLIDAAASQWMLPLHAREESASCRLDTDPVADYLAHQFLIDHTAEAALQQEILASLSPIAPETAPVAKTFSRDVVITAYRKLCDRSREAAELETMRQELSSTRDALAQQIQQLTRQRDDQTRLMTETQAKIDTLAQEKSTLTAELNESRQEGELLLTQLHQVQEELESVFLKEQQTAQALAATQAELNSAHATRDKLNQQITELTKARDEQIKLAAERQKNIEKLTVDRENEQKTAAGQRQQLEKKLQALEKTSAEQRAQLEQRAQSLEKTASEQRKQLEQQTVQLKQQIQALQKQTQSLSNEKGTLSKELEDARQEGELLLTQLHQVQEELEHYFLEHQKIKQEKQAQDKRLQRMLQRISTYCDYASLQVAAGDVAGVLNWRIEGLETAGRQIECLECSTQLLDNTATLRFKPGAPLPLCHWTGKADPEGILIAPALEGAREDLASLAPSDLQLLQNLAGVFQQALSTPASLALPADYPASDLQRAFAEWPDQLAKLPTALRFDRVTLRNNQVNPDYEHIWFAIENLMLGQQHWAHFEFRLSCANVRPRRFGTHPKLEFPQETGQAPLPGWFDESYDDFGSKLELRFALPEAMDVQVWGELGDTDRRFMVALLDALPGLLNALEAGGTQLSRAWKDWHDLAENARRILEIRAPEARALLA